MNPIVSHFAEVLVGVLGTQLLLGGVALLWFYAVGKRIISVEIPAFMSVIKERMEKIEKRLEDIEKDLRELITARGESRVRLDNVDIRLHGVEDRERERAHRSGSRRPT